MNPQVGRLESLLAKIRRNAVRPRAQAAPPMVQSPMVDASPVMADEIVEEEREPLHDEPTAVRLPTQREAQQERAVSGVVSVPQLAETEELLDDDIVEVAASEEAQVPATGPLDDIEIDFDNEEDEDKEQPPASSSRTRSAPCRLVTKNLN